MTRRLAAAAWLTAVWIALWGDLSVANIASGLLVAAILLTAFPMRSGATVRVRPLRLAALVAHFLLDLVRASIEVTWQVVRPHPRLQPGVITAPIPPLPPALAVLVADAISLTPGTLTVELRVNAHLLRVHVLDTDEADAIRRDIDGLVERARSAFPSPPLNEATSEHLRERP